MIKPKLTWKNNCLYVGGQYFGTFEIDLLNQSSFTLYKTISLHNDDNRFLSEQGAIEHLEVWAKEFFWSIHEGAIDGDEGNLK